MGFHRGVEALVLRGGEDGYGRGVVPVVDEGGVVAAHDEGGAGHDGESFGDGGQRRVERGAGGDELGEEASDGGFAVGDAGVQAERRGPVDCDVDPVSVQDAVGGRGIRPLVGEIVAGIITPGRQRSSAEAGLVVGRADGGLRLPDGAQHVGRRGAIWRCSKKIQRINPCFGRVQYGVVLQRIFGKNRMPPPVLLAEAKDVVHRSLVEPAWGTWEVVVGPLGQIEFAAVDCVGPLRVNHGPQVFPLHACAKDIHHRRWH